MTLKANPFALFPLATVCQMVAESLQKKKVKKQFLKTIPLSKKLDFASMRSSQYFAEIFTKISSLALKAFQAFIVTGHWLNL